MRKAVFILIGLVIASFSPLEAHLSDKTNTLVHDLNQAAFLEFYLIKKDNNPLISPYSIQSSFLMAYMGARGQTATQIAQALYMSLSREELGPAFSDLYDYLYSPKMSDTQYELKVGNGMWVNKNFTIRSSYKKLVEQDFRGEIQHVDFTDPQTAVDTINAWVSLETNGIIEQFLSPKDLTNSTRALLTNGLILKGAWKYPFDTKLTGSRPFLASNKISRNVLMMHQTHVIPYYEDSDSQVVALPLQSQDDQAEIALIIFLPKDSKLKEIFDFYYSLQQNNQEGFLDFVNKLQETKVDLFIPKFSFTKRSFLKNFFMSIGIRDAFTAAADFSGITGNKDLFISNAFHESFISIDEYGVLAAAASGISFDLKSSFDKTPAKSFIANHPFFYCIADLKTKLLLFMGVLNDPSLSLHPEKYK